MEIVSCGRAAIRDYWLSRPLSLCLLLRHLNDSLTTKSDCNLASNTCTAWKESCKREREGGGRRGGEGVHVRTSCIEPLTTEEKRLQEQGTGKRLFFIVEMMCPSFVQQLSDQHKGTVGINWWRFSIILPNTSAAQFTEFLLFSLHFWNICRSDT